jgi:hypothetical protein
MLTKHGLSLLRTMAVLRTARSRNIGSVRVVSLCESLGLGHPVSSITAVPVQHYAIHTDSLPPSIAVVYTGNRESGDAFVVADDDGWNNCELEEARG